MTRQEAELQLKMIFGINHFYDEQWEAVSRILNGERILLIQRTGFGKSLCYQFPATQFTGLTIIFSPLIALMRDQVKSLIQKGIEAAYINSEQSIEENRAVIKRAINGELKILYIAPERQENEEWKEAIQYMKLSMVVVDEAHTISTWGHDFRPAFKRIITLVQQLPTHMPALATTATATKRTQQDIEQQLGDRLTTVRGCLARENLELKTIVVKSEEEKMIWLAHNLNKIHGSGFIYTGTRIDAEQYALWLQFVGIQAIYYHAGLDVDTRRYIEEGLMNNQWKCVVSTNALGMGIDKPDLRFVIHTQLPASPIHYYQEIGRAGRDGKMSKIILFYNDKKIDDIAADKELPLHFIDSARPTTKQYQRVINLLKEEPLTEREIKKKGNLKQGQVRIIKADLIEQNIAQEVIYGNKKTYEYKRNAPALDTQWFEQLRKQKLMDLDKMEQYVYTTQPRMKFLCNFLDSYEPYNYTNCDNTNLPKEHVVATEEDFAKLEEFHNTYFPLLETADKVTKPKSGITLYYSAPNVIFALNGNKACKYVDHINYNDFTGDDLTNIKEIEDKLTNKASRLTNGYAASYYGVSNIGSTIHRCKYENGGDFPDYLLIKTLSVIGKKFGKVKFDVVLFVPPTHSGNLVRNFAQKIAATLKVPISDKLVKTRETQEQKIFQNSYNKKDNVQGAFNIDDSVVKNKTILLIDDIYDSGATFKEIGKMLSDKGANFIVPIAIAKTVGGTL